MKNSNEIYMIHDHKMLLDDKDSLGLSTGTYETRETELVKQEVKRGDIVIDIGANVGYYTLIFAKLVGETGKVFAFEPEPENFALLKKNVEMNEYSNVILVQKAVSNQNGTTQLYLCEDNRGMHRVYDSVFCHKSIEIDSLRLDDYFQQYDEKISFIKIDIEGAEYPAIQGMQNLLRENREVKVLTEFSPAASLEYGVDSKNYISTLINLGFSIYSVGKNVEIIKTNELYAQLAILKEVVNELQEELKAGYHETSIEYLTSVLNKRLQNKNYTRPLLENFFCMR